MNEFLEWVLTPSKHDERSKSLSVLLADWDAAVKLCRSYGGYAPPETTGMTRQQVRWFAKGLRTADERGHVGGDRAWLDRLLAFLDADGLGGFTLERKWKRCQTRTNPGTMAPAEAKSAQPLANTDKFHPRVKGCLFVIDPSKAVH